MADADIPEPPGSMELSEFIRRHTKKDIIAFFDHVCPGLTIEDFRKRITATPIESFKLISIQERMAGCTSAEFKDLADAVGNMIAINPVRLNHPQLPFDIHDMPDIVLDFFKSRDSSDLIAVKLFFRGSGAPVGRDLLAAADYKLLVHTLTLWHMYEDPSFHMAATKKNGVLQYDLLTEAAERAAKVMLGEVKDYGRGITALLKLAMRPREANQEDKSRHRLGRKQKKEPSPAGSYSSDSSGSSTSSGPQRKKSAKRKKSARKAPIPQAKGKAVKACYTCGSTLHLQNACPDAAKKKKKRNK